MLKKKLFLAYSKLKQESFDREWVTLKKTSSIGQMSKTYDEYLETLLLHSKNTIPFYNNILAKTDVINEYRKLAETFTTIPLLTKKIVMEQGENLFQQIMLSENGTIIPQVVLLVSPLDSFKTLLIINGGLQRLGITMKT